MMNAVRIGGSNVSFTMKSYVFAPTRIAGRALLFTCREYIRISLCYCVLFLTNACTLLLLKWSGRVFSVLYQDSACLHTNTKNIYITHTSFDWIYWTGGQLSKYNMLLVKGQVFIGNVGHFRILQKYYKQYIMLAIYWLLFSQANSNTTPIKTMHYNLKHVTSRRFIVDYICCWLTYSINP
jgi:hypothetical protein